jgi:hypothetical protein
MQTVQIGADIVVRDSGGNLLAWIDVRNREDLSPEIAAVLRRNLVTHGYVSTDARYFMLVSQEFGYLWDEREARAGVLPSLPIVFSVGPIVRHYLPSLVDGDRLSGSQLELAITQWLWDLANTVEDRPREPETSLAGTDFVRSIEGGRVGSDDER